MSGSSDARDNFISDDFVLRTAILILYIMQNKAVQAQTVNEQRITSLEIAEIAGKQHKDLLRSIQEQEESWEKVCKRKFTLTSHSVGMPNGGFREIPMYSLTKTESLYIISKFNDEVRAKLVLRWYDLESQHNQLELLTDILKVSNTKLRLRLAARLGFTPELPNNSIAQLIAQYLSPGDRFMTNTEIKDYLEEVTGTVVSQRKLGLELQQAGFERTTRRTAYMQVRKGYLIQLP